MKRQAHYPPAFSFSAQDLTCFLRDITDSTRQQSHRSGRAFIIILLIIAIISLP